MVTSWICAQAATRLELDKVDLLMVPTVLHHYTVAEIEGEEKVADEVGLLKISHGQLQVKLLQALTVCRSFAYMVKQFHVQS